MVVSFLYISLLKINIHYISTPLDLTILITFGEEYKL
jgi:hypothetical protein